jgi:GT2 family glycosyltransferase
MGIFWLVRVSELVSNSSMLHLLTLSYNGKDKLLPLYNSLFKHNLQFIWHIKDNGSKDGTVEEFKNINNDRINIIQYPHNKDNYSYGCNFLFKEANPKDDDTILLLNNDVLFTNDINLHNMIFYFDDHKDIGVLGARLLFTNSTKIQHGGVVFPNHRLPVHFRLNEEKDDISKLNREFQALTGAVWLTRADIYKNIWTKNKSGQAGFDEQYQWSFEDVDACLAIKYNLNKKIVYYGNTDIYHEQSASLKKNPVNKLFIDHNVKHFLSKWDKKYIIDADIYKRDIKYNLYK